MASPVPDSYGLRVDATLARTGPGATLAGPTAAWAWSAETTRPLPAVVIAVPRERALRQRPGVTVTRANLPPDLIVDVDGRTVTTPARTAVDLARGLGSPWMSFDERVAAVDALLRATGCSPGAADDLAAHMPGRGLTGARRVLASAREGVDSIPETRLRLLVQRAAFSEPVIQCPVVLDGRVIARLDLGWPDRCAGLEYDGAVHREAVVWRRDLARHNAIRSAGWNVLRVDAGALAAPAVMLGQLARWVPRRG